MRISLEFSCKWTLDFDQDFVFIEKHNFLVNLRTGKIINQITKGGSIGYVLKGKFYSLSKLRQHVIKIEKQKTPF